MVINRLSLEIIAWSYLGWFYYRTIQLHIYFLSLFVSLHLFSFYYFLSQKAMCQNVQIYMRKDV